MTNYNDGKWIGWNGGERPVHPDTVVMAALHDETNERRPFDGFSDVSVKAGSISDGCWQHHETYRHVIAFRVVKEHREPRELHLRMNPSWGWVECSSQCEGAIKFREVLE